MGTVTARRAAGRLDLVGAAGLVALAVWVGVAAGRGDGRSGPVLALLAAMAAAAAAARAITRRPGGVERLVAGGVLVFVAATWPGVLRTTGAPTGYENANATLTALAALAAIGAAASPSSERASWRWSRTVWWVVAVLATGITFATGSVAGVACLLVAEALLLVAWRRRRARIVLVAGGALVAGVLAATVALGALADPTEQDGSSAIGARRQLWASAVDLVRAEPLTGVGAGGFASSRAPGADTDLRWAHHGYLQAAAEWGVPGLVLLLGLAAWTWIALWTAAGDRPAPAAVAAAALVVVGLHGTVDYVWHVAAVPLVLAALVGAGTARPVRVSRREVPGDGRPDRGSPG
jgi:O-antigen ligase